MDPLSLKWSLFISLTSVFAKELRCRGEILIKGLNNLHTGIIEGEFKPSFILTLERQRLKELRV